MKITPHSATLASVHYNGDNWELSQDSMGWAIYVGRTRVTGYRRTKWLALAELAKFSRCID